MSSSIYLIFGFFARILMLLLVLPVVNYARGLVAIKQGDDTPEVSGALTLNPMRHLDMLGSLLILLCGFGWTKPMPINYSRMKNMRRGVILVALTGPLTLFIMSILCRNISAIVIFTIESTAGGALKIIFDLLSQISVCLGVLYLLPFPGFDGFTLLYHLGGVKFRNWYHRNQPIVDRLSFYIVLSLFFIDRITFGFIDPLGWLILLVDRLLNFTLFWIPMVFK